MWSFLFISNHLQASGWELASSHPETHYLSFLKGCFLYQIQRFMGDSIGRQQGSGGRVLQMQFSTNTSPSKPPSIMAPATRLQP